MMWWLLLALSHLSSACIPMKPTDPGIPATAAPVTQAPVTPAPGCPVFETYDLDVCGAYIAANLNNQNGCQAATITSTSVTCAGPNGQHTQLTILGAKGEVRTKFTVVCDTTRKVWKLNSLTGVDLSNTATLPAKFACRTPP